MAATGSSPPLGVERRLLLVALVVLALGLYFRCAHLDARPFGNDEGLRSTQALLIEGAPQPPLYYLLVRLWAGLAGDSVVSVRAFSLLAGLLAIPLGCWLGRELFGSWCAAGLAAALLAVSPLHVLSSQQARADALGTVAVLGSCLALLRALRREGRRDWAVYDLTVAIGIYTHFMFLPVMVAQGVCVAAWTRNTDARPGRLDPSVLRYLKATAGGVLAFLPWALIMVGQRAAARAPAHASAGWETLLTPLIAPLEAPGYLAASFVVAGLLARECESPAIHWRRVSQGAAAAVLLCGVLANAARGWPR